MQSFSLVEMWRSMGFLAKGVAILLIVMAIYMLALTIERAIRYARGSKESFKFVLALREQLQKSNVDGALAAAKSFTWSPIARMLEAGLHEYKTGLKLTGDFDRVDAVNRSLERTKERETTNLRRGLSGLATIASAAPFIGLFGTVVGIINAFRHLSGGGGLDVVGPGIAEALMTTAVGLFVAIPALVAFNFFTGLVERYVVDMNDVSSEFVDYVLKEGLKDEKAR